MRKKVLIIVENLPVPFDSRVWKEACALREAGYEVAVLSPRGRGYTRNHEILAGVHIYRHPMPREANTPLAFIWEYGWALFWEFLYACWIFLTRGFHVIQGCNPPDNLFLVALPFKLFGVKYIFDHHDATPELYYAKYGKKNSFYHIQIWLERLTYRFSNVVMATNESYKTIAVNRGHVDPDRLFVVRNGPDLAWFQPVPAIPELKYGKTYLIGYVGTMSVQEGLDLLIDVVLHLKTQGRHDVHFTCVGGGPGLTGLRALVKEKNLEDTINFTGRVPNKELLAILSTADICINPDKPCEMNNISTMIKIMEYMALGKPMVQFELKEGRFSAGDASLYADSRDAVRDFAAKILWLLDHPDARQRMGGLGRHRVEKTLAWEHSIPHLLAAYQKALSNQEKQPTPAHSVVPDRN